jgi:hypothetical protein
MSTLTTPTQPVSSYYVTSRFLAPVRISPSLTFSTFVDRETSRVPSDFFSSFSLLILTIFLILNFEFSISFILLFYLLFLIFAFGTIFIELLLCFQLSFFVRNFALKQLWWIRVMQRPARQPVPVPRRGRDQQLLPSQRRRIITWVLNLVVLKYDFFICTYACSPPAPPELSHSQN